MKKVTIKATDMKPENDKAKKIYRLALDIIRRLDDIGKQRRAFKEVFLPEAVNLRNRLQDYCERLIFYNPAEYGRKAEELLWRKVFYDVIQLMKHNRKQMKPNNNLESAFRMHLSAAIGYYNHLLLKLQSEYSLKLEGVVDLYHYPEPKNHRKSAMWGQKREPEPEVRDWALKACHRCLVQLGDLCRYQQDYDEHRSEVVAQRYYYQAITLTPHIGMPHNQLGTLAGNKSYNLEAIYHYLRCISSPITFEGAEGNLLRLFERNRKRYTELTQTSPRDLPPDQQRFKDIKRFFVRFIQLQDVFFSRNSSTPAKEVQDLCQVTLQDFNLCMFYQSPSAVNLGCSLDLRTHDDKPTFLEDDMVFKVTVICMIAIHSLQSAGNKHVTAAIAFSLALFSHILNHVVIRLQSTLYELENPRKIIHIVSEDEKGGTTTTDFDEEQEVSKESKRRSLPRRGDSFKKDLHKDDKQETLPVDKKKQKMKKLLHKRRRRRGSDSSSGSGSGVESEDSESSEDGLRVVSDDSETELQFLNQSSSSDSDSDNLMISQEMRPGFSDFSQGPPSSSQEDSPDSGQGLTIAHKDIDQALHESPLNNNNKYNFNSLISDMQHQNMNNNHSDSFKSGINDGSNSIEDGSKSLMTDGEQLVSSYLKEFPVDWLQDSSSIFSQTLHLAKLLVDGEKGDSEIQAVIQGTKEVKVPPGFETSTESVAVQEITEKIANFNIETDTDTSNLMTDTECSTVTTESEMETETETDRESVIDRTEVAKQRVDRLLKVISKEGLLSSIKIFSDWMRCNQHIIATCAKSSTSLWARLSLLLNFFPLEVDLVKPDICQNNELIQELQKLPISHPLTEDFHLQCFQPLENAHVNLDFSSRLDLDIRQEAILRVCVLRRFGHFIGQMKSISFHFDQEKAMFFGPVHNETPEGEQAAQQQMAEAQAKRNQLMKDMAQLRLKAEVSQLEGSLQSTDRPSLPPYLVPDTSVVCDSLTQLKQLAHSARFIIIIPFAVIDHLDFLKKESPRARDAIRWLEAEFKKGNRYVRAQKLHEKTSKLPHKNMKKKDRDAWRYVQIVDCAKYLSTQTSQEEPNKGMVSVLTNHSITSPHVSIRVKQVITTAQQEGLSIQNTAEFYNKWKDVCKSNSKG